MYPPPTSHPGESRDPLSGFSACGISGEFAVGPGFRRDDSYWVEEPNIIPLYGFSTSIWIGPSARPWMNWLT